MKSVQRIRHTELTNEIHNVFRLLLCNMISYIALIQSQRRVIIKIENIKTYSCMSWIIFKFEINSSYILDAVKREIFFYTEIAVMVCQILNVTYCKRDSSTSLRLGGTCSQLVMCAWIIPNSLVVNINLYYKCIYRVFKWYKLLPVKFISNQNKERRFSVC